MPSPFPGMDPYLEEPVVWPDFHNALADQIRGMLNHDLPAPYYAQLDTRSEVGIIDDLPHRAIVPDVTVRRLTTAAEDTAAVAVLEPRAEVSESWEFRFEVEATELGFVEIRDSSRGHQVVTVIEILSPSNKRGGEDRDAFLKKRSEVLASDVSLVEVDLLRTGDRSWTSPEIGHQLLSLDPRPDYLVTVNRSWQRGARFRLQIFPISLRGKLPVVVVPLREGEPEIPLDLQYAFQQVYESGPYRRGAVDYAAPPNPPLPEDQQAWAAQRVQQWLARIDELRSTPQT